ncbi:MAG: hypothetical protein IRY99_27865, partial [Isosphaeraceae bacterium]|nr:hypothetical protein [Isosphaeraceae bacterium]
MPRGRRERWASVGRGLALALAAVVAALLPSAAARAAPPAKHLDYKNHSFRIPITIEPAIRPRLREVRLYVSTDQGTTWDVAGRTTPEQPFFTFKAQRDGEYWFAVRTVDIQGQIYPRDDQPAEPSLKVSVDSTPPTVVLEPAGRRGSRAAVRWEVKDEHLVLDSLVLEYQAVGARDWRKVPIRQLGLIGGEEWEAGTADPIKVRASIKDRAGNEGSATITLGDGIAAEPGPVAPADPNDFAPPPAISPIASQ